MRIIAGQFKGKKLKTFVGDAIRPTSDRARESLFNIIAPRLLNCSFLDLCAGTGAVGIEAISRNAKCVEFVDIDKESVKIAEFNLKSIGKNVKVNLCDAKRYLLTTTKKFDVIFYDPPYENKDIEDVLSIVLKNKILNDGGVFIYEHKVDRPSKDVEGYLKFDSRKYGIAVFDFYKYEV